jgi:hypothetical protein
LKTKEIIEVNFLIAAQEYIDPNTILKREIYENKLDSLIFHKLKHDRDFARLNRSRKMVSSKKLIMSKIVEDYQIPVNELEVSQDIKDKYLKPISIHADEIMGSEISSRGRMALEEIEELTDEDF